MGGAVAAAYGPVPAVPLDLLAADAARRPSRYAYRLALGGPGDDDRGDGFSRVPGARRRAHACAGARAAAGGPHAPPARGYRGDRFIPDSDQPARAVDPGR